MTPLPWITLLDSSQAESLTYSGRPANGESLIFGKGDAVGQVHSSDELLDWPRRR
jgi:hypothetical protein